MTSTIKSSMGIREWGMLITLSILWGGSFFFVGVVVSELPPFTIVTLRVGLAALTLWSIALLMGLRPPQSVGVWFMFFVMGSLNNALPFTLIVWGQSHIASGLASILNATTPLFTVIVAGLLLPDERITPLKLIGVSIGFAGVVVMFGPFSFTGGANLLAQLAILGAAVSYAFAGAYGRRFKRLGISPIVIAAGQVTASTVILVPLALSIDGVFDASALGISSWASLIALGVLSTAMAYVLYFKILDAAGATNLLLVTLLVPVSAILLGSLVLGERLDTVHFVGMALIGLGLSAIDGRLWRRYGPMARESSAL